MAFDPVNPDPHPRQVICAAMRHKEDGLIICGKRHGDQIMLDVVHRIYEGQKWGPMFEQGFIDNSPYKDGGPKFLNRKEAWKVAKAAGQLPEDAPEEGSLFSEDLY